MRKFNVTVQTVAEPTSEAAEDDGKISAVIAAAISVYMEKNHPGTRYRIRSFKRI